MGDCLPEYNAEFMLNTEKPRKYNINEYSFEAKRPVI